MLAITNCAHAGPPFITDDPEPVDYGHYEFYVASQQVLTEDGRVGTLPQLEFNYGAAPDLQLHIIVPYAFNSPADAPTRRGIGDTELGMKYRFLQETDTQAMVGIFPLVITDTGNAQRGLGNGGTQVFLPLWVQKKWGDWQSYGGGGYWINDAPNTKNHWFVGWQLQRDLSDQWTLGAEIFHDTGQIQGQGSSTGFNVGGNYNLDAHHHLLFSVGKGLTNSERTNRFSSYVAYQLTL
jgi:hypothetical protein